MAKKHLVWIPLVMMAAACAPHPESPSPQSQQILTELGCADAETRLFDRLIDGDLASATKDPETVRHGLTAALRSRFPGHGTVERLDELLKFLLEDAPARAPRKDAASLRRLYAAMELGLTPDDDVRALVDAYQARQGVWNDVRELGLVCEAGARVSAQSKIPAPSVFAGRLGRTLVQGMRWTFAVAYQSCEALLREPLTGADPNVEGIKVDGWHPDHVGRRRFVDNLPLVQRTHPYLFSPPAAVCTDVRLNPLIYDYGGRPFIGSSEVDLHRNEGSGTSALGIDCSAYVGTSLATAGLRTKAGLALRPEQAGLYSSHDFLNPEKNKLNCLKRIPLSPQETLRDGDIVAVSGHVFMLDRVGADPFGTRRAQTAAECEALTTDGFDFAIFQSSPEKEGVGLNHYVAKDYLTKEGKVRTGLLKYAVQSCKNRLAGKTSTPAYGDISVVRHLGTAACLDSRIPIAREACVSSCYGG